jgi:hypothetical protein
MAGKKGHGVGAESDGCHWRDFKPTMSDLTSCAASAPSTRQQTCSKWCFGAELCGHDAVLPEEIAVSGPVATGAGHRQRCLVAGERAQPIQSGPNSSSGSIKVIAPSRARRSRKLAVGSGWKACSTIGP